MGDCLQCGKRLQGRQGKKFCDTYCRAAYHNNRRRSAENRLTAVNRILRRNWRILSILNPQGRSTLRKAYLMEQGYDFNYFTNIYRTKKGRIYYFCYDVGVTDMDGTHVCIVNWQGYMDSFRHPLGSMVPRTT